MSVLRNRKRLWVVLTLAQGLACGSPLEREFPEALAGAGNQCPLSEGGVSATGGEGGAVTSGAGSSSPCGTSRWVLLSNVPNVRGLGGIALENGATVACGQLYRGSYLSSLTEIGCEAFATLGIKSVIDLRSLGEQTQVPAACVTQQARVTSAPLPVPYNVSPADYLACLYTAPSMQAAISVLADETSYPVYFHCHYGKDRTSVFAAVVLLALGASREAILADYVLSGEAGFSYYVDSITAVLDEIERIGGIDAYFAEVGVPEEQVEAMRTILTASTDAS